MFPIVFVICRSDHNIQTNLDGIDSETTLVVKEHEGSESTERTMSEEAQLPMLRLAEAVQTASHERYYGLPELSIEAHVVRATEAAKQEGRTLPGNYQLPIGRPDCLVKRTYFV
jgi:hypothetical protein